MSLSLLRPSLLFSSGSLLSTSLSSLSSFSIRSYSSSSASYPSSSPLSPSSFSSIPHSALLIPYHGPTGKPPSLLLASPEELSIALEQSLTAPSWTLTPRQLCDIELLLSGAFSPLDGFLNKKNYLSVIENYCLADNNNTLWPLPITLDVNEELIKQLKSNNNNNKTIALRDAEGTLIALMDINDYWEIDKNYEAEKCFKGDSEHPAIQYLMKSNNNYYIGGKIRGLRLPPHADDIHLRHTPSSLRSLFSSSINNQSPWSEGNIVAFQTRNPLHRAHYELTIRAQKSLNAKLLLHPVVGMTKPGDIDAVTRVKCYKEIMKKYPKDEAMLSLLQLAMRMAGPREALLHAIIRQNYGATHFIIGRDHAGPGSNSKGVDFYSPFEARDGALARQSQLKIKLVPFDQMVYVESEQKYYPSAEVPKGTKVQNLSGTEVRKRLSNGTDIPEWFSFTEIVRILRSAYRSPLKKGFCVFLTGLSGAGKSTIANALYARLIEKTDRDIQMLDGDLVRKFLSSELTFSKEHRNLNIRRIGYVASLLVRGGSAVIAAPIAPYQESRDAARALVEGEGGRFIEVYVSTPVSACEARDTKGLYLKARKGLLKHFTGLDDPYQPPTRPDIIVDTSKQEENYQVAVDKIWEILIKEGLVKSEEKGENGEKGGEENNNNNNNNKIGK